MLRDSEIFDSFKFFTKNDYLPRIYQEKPKNEPMNERKWFIHNMKNAAFVNTHTRATQRRRRILKAQSIGQWEFDKEWFKGETSPNLHQALRFNYENSEDMSPVGATFNDEYVGA